MSSKSLNIEKVLLFLNAGLFGVLITKQAQSNQTLNTNQNTDNENYSFVIPEGFSIEYMDNVNNDNEAQTYQNYYNICLFIFIIVGILIILQFFITKFKSLSPYFNVASILIFIILICYYAYVSKKINLQLLNYLFYSIISITIQTIRTKLSKTFQNVGDSSEILLRVLQTLNYNLGNVGFDLKRTSTSLDQLVSSDLKKVLQTAKQKIGNLSYSGILGKVS
jgi:NADH:ubiquinone oxidoreductase subunit 3 (subunit A)